LISTASKTTSAIQPEVLQREIEAMLEHVGEPGRFIRECMKLLEYYADRARRSGRIPAEVASERVLRVPRPVLLFARSAQQSIV